NSFQRSVIHYRACQVRLDHRLYFLLDVPRPRLRARHDDSLSKVQLLSSHHLTHSFFVARGALRSACGLLRVTPVVEDADLMHALQCAGRGAPLFRIVLALEIFHRVLFERNAWIAALLRAPVNEAVLADVEVARSGAAAPFVG